MFCRNCGAPLTSEDNFCPSCGFMVEKENGEVKHENLLFQIGERIDQTTNLDLPNLADPVNSTPVMEQPSMEIPVNPSPVMEQPSMEVPVNPSPVMEQPSIEVPVTPVPIPNVIQSNVDQTMQQKQSKANKKILLILMGIGILAIVAAVLVFVIL